MIYTVISDVFGGGGDGGIPNSAGGFGVAMMPPEAPRI